MRISIAPYTAELSEAVRQFNARLAASEYAEFQFPEDPAGFAAGFPAEAFLALEDGVMRGGYILRRYECWVRGGMRRVSHYRLPISEGAVNRAYAAVGAQMLRTAMKTEPLLFALGMGGVSRPLPQMLKAMRWGLYPVPFLFRVERPGRFLREIRPLRTSAPRRAAVEAARATGLGWMAIRAAQAWAARRLQRPVRAELVSEFGAWADKIWAEAHPRYSLIALRDRRTLNALYPPAEERFLRLKAEDKGWAVTLDTRMHDHRQFGGLRVGTIVDCLARPEDAAVVVASAAALLASRGVDLIISNQSHQAWVGALKRAGFLAGPSNYAFAASPKLRELLEPFETGCGEAHLNRGDGDGPIHL